MFFFAEMAFFGDSQSPEAGSLELIAAIQSGDRRAEDVFLPWVLERITPVIKRKVGIGKDEWKDVRQKCCIEVLKCVRQGKYDPQKAPIGAFIAGIVRNSISSYFRSRSRQASKMTLMNFNDSTRLFGLRIRDITERIDDEEKERHEHLRRCIEQLPESQRIAVIYSFYGGEKHQQIGLRLNKNPQQVAELKRLAKVRLKKCMENFYHA